ncbi:MULTISPECIES: hypothetical protein [unclassified Streptomyces]|nr:MULTISPECIES: hypothetical protein [unclassified Streptomyces]
MTSACGRDGVPVGGGCLLRAGLTDPAGQGQTIRIVLDDGYPPETGD